jgi:hypothetical protein
MLDCTLNNWSECHSETDAITNNIEDIFIYARAVRERLSNTLSSSSLSLSLSHSLTLCLSFAVSFRPSPYLLYFPSQCPTQRAHIRIYIYKCESANGIRSNLLAHYHRQDIFHTYYYYFSTHCAIIGATNSGIKREKSPRSTYRYMYKYRIPCTAERWPRRRPEKRAYINDLHIARVRYVARTRGTKITTCGTTRVPTNALHGSLFKGPDRTSNFIREPKSDRTTLKR